MRLEDPADQVVYNIYKSRRVPVPSSTPTSTLPVMVVVSQLRVRRTAPRRVDNISFQPSSRRTTPRPAAPRLTTSRNFPRNGRQPRTSTAAPVRAPVRTVPPQRVAGAPPPLRTSTTAAKHRSAGVVFGRTRPALASRPRMAPGVSAQVVGVRVRSLPAEGGLVSGRLAV